MSDLISLSSIYPFIEWGILFSKSKEGTNRYPSQDWINEFSKNDLISSAHFCGWYSKEVLKNNNFKLINDLYNCFKRIQLNYNFEEFHNFNNIDFIHQVSDSNKKIIIQENDNNNLFIKSLLNVLDLSEISARLRL